MIRTSSAPRLTLVGWQSVAADRMARLYATETARWATKLEWDTARGWQEVEQGRILGTVSGVVVDDGSGGTAGWSYYLIHNGALQVGSFVADSEAAAQLMLDHILDAQTLALVDTVTLFAFADAPGLAAALRQRGLTVDRYWYLGCDLERRPPVRTADVRQWRVDDVKATAELLERAYESQDAARPFAPQSTPEAWADYVDQLTTGFGCGTLMPEASFAIPSGPGRLLGAALVTRVSETTAHLAQLAVEQPMRGRHVGGRLVELACAAAAQAGCRRLTLLVGARNSRARGLYESLRFETVASFLSAGTIQPRRLTSVAGGGVVMTRR